MNRFTTLRKVLPVALGALTLTLLLAALWRPGAASTAMDRLFQSVLQPTATTSARLPATVAPTATARGGRAAPTATPAARVLNAAYIRRLPLVLKGWPPTPTPTATATPTRTATSTATPTPTPIQYGWKGIGHGWEAAYLTAVPANQFWGLAPNWWYDWGSTLYTPTPGAAAASSSAATLALLEAGLQDIGYVPMIHCPNDSAATYPAAQDAAGLARRYPGRVWLLFNEPDNLDACGGAIDSNPDPKTRGIVANKQWDKLGLYLGEQYVLYYDAIKVADPTARVFAFNPISLPMPDLIGLDPNFNGVLLWNRFLQEIQRQGRPLDGIALHAYPNNSTTWHSGCAHSFLDYPCLQRALPDAYKFFQGTDAAPSKNNYQSLTIGKPIWITEIGSLTSVDSQSWLSTRNDFESPMIVWFKQNLPPGGSCQYIDAVAWFATHSKDPNGTWDYTASNLLNHLTFPAQHQLTAVGVLWRDTTCFNCQCASPNCP